MSLPFVQQRSSDNVADLALENLTVSDASSAAREGASCTRPELSARQQHDANVDLRAYLSKVAQIDVDALPLNQSHCLLSGSVVTRTLSQGTWPCNDVDVYCHASVLKETREAFLKAHPHYLSFSVSNEKGRDMSRLCHKPDVYRTDKRIESVETFRRALSQEAEIANFQIIVIRDDVSLVDMVASFDLSVACNWFDGSVFHAGDVPGIIGNEGMHIINASDRELLEVWCDPAYTSLMARTAAAQAVVLKHYDDRFKNYNFVKPSYLGDRPRLESVCCTGLYQHITVLMQRIAKYHARGFALAFNSIFIERLFLLATSLKSANSVTYPLRGLGRYTTWEDDEVDWFKSWMATFEGVDGENELDRDGTWVKSEHSGRPSIRAPEV